eukprot:26530-Pleurochrysis_carterae.AAC.2
MGTQVGGVGAGLSLPTEARLGIVRPHQKPPAHTGACARAAKRRTRGCRAASTPPRLRSRPRNDDQNWDGRTQQGECRRACTERHSGQSCHCRRRQRSPRPRQR